jgi:hypothetical protein
MKFGTVDVSEVHAASVRRVEMYNVNVPTCIGCGAKRPNGERFMADTRSELIESVQGVLHTNGHLIFPCPQFLSLWTHSSPCGTVGSTSYTKPYPSYSDPEDRSRVYRRNIVITIDINAVQRSITQQHEYVEICYNSKGNTGNAMYKRLHWIKNKNH